MAARRKKRWKTIVPTATLTVIPFVLDAPVANAFFPPVIPPTVVVPPVVPPPFLPPVLPPIIVPPVIPPVVPPIVVPPVVPPCGGGCHDPHPTCNTPEPATLVTGLFGLVTAAGYGLFRRKKDGAGAEPVDHPE